MKTVIHRKTLAAGLTLVEILMGVAVLGVLLAVAAPSLSDLMDKRRVIAVAGEIAGILAYAKAESNSTNSLLYVRFDPNTDMSCAAVTTQGSGNTECDCWKPQSTICLGGSARLVRLFQVPKSNGVQFAASANAWSGYEYHIKFLREQMNMDTTTYAFVDVTGRKAKLKVELNGAGRVRICSPDGNINGYVRCA